VNCFGYLTKKMTIAMVNKAIVVIKTLCAQRAIGPSMLSLPVNEIWCNLGVAAVAPLYGYKSVQFKLGLGRDQTEKFAENPRP
jgi:hypothetical protein